MIDDDTLLLIKNSFYQSPDNQTLVIPNEKADEFWDWFKGSAKRLEIFEGEVEKYNKPDVYKAGRCFGNSQSTMLEYGLRYYEGFAKIDQNYLFHGFNIDAENVIDVTVISNPDKFIEYQFGLPDGYYGIPIEKEFVLMHNNEDLNNNRMNIRYLVYLLFLEVK